MFHLQLILLREIFQKNGYPENFIEKVLQTIVLQTRAKLQNSIKGVLNCCKLQVIFKSRNKFQCGLCNEYYYRECVRHLAIRSGKHIGISPLTNKKVPKTGFAVN